MSWLSKVNLGGAPFIQQRREKIIAVVACGFGILGTAELSHWVVVYDDMMLVASMGASAVILFALPGSPLAQPWPFLGGHLLSGAIGIGVAQTITDPSLAAGAAVGGAVLIMSLLRCLHPPGAATALVPVLSGSVGGHYDAGWLLQPLALNVVLMLWLTLVINRLILRRDYPARQITAKPGAQHDQDKNSAEWLGIDQTDIEAATQTFSAFLDIGSEDLRKLLTQLQLVYCQKHQQAPTCRDIMFVCADTLDYATEVEAAWTLMHERRLKALPVLDRARRVIGIVTWQDFLKNLRLVPYDTFQERWLAFIKRTPRITTNKPEAVGHIMSRKVTVLNGDDTIIEVVPLVLDSGHQFFPVVDHERRFVGMLSQEKIIAALFNQAAALAALQANPQWPR